MSHEDVALHNINTLHAGYKNSADDILIYFSYSSQKIGFDISCKLSPKETLCMKYQSILRE